MGNVSEESFAPAPAHVSAAKLNEESQTEVLPGLRIKADGTVVRNFDRTLPTTDPKVSLSPVFVAGVASKDVVFDSETDIWGRVFLPESVAAGLSKKLPLVVYFHSGGFCIGNAEVKNGAVRSLVGEVSPLATHVTPCRACFYCQLTALIGGELLHLLKVDGEGPTYHATRLCKMANVAVICASYRLAPESRLPIAFNDAFTTMSWLQKQCKYRASGDEDAGDAWLMNNVDFARVFIMGQSAGGNIAHHVVVSKPVEELYPLTIDGVILVVPFFSAEELSESEKLLSEDEALPLEMNRTFWRLALPEGANRDHPFCNPVSADAVRQLAGVKVLPRMLLVVAGRDPLNTRQLQYYHALKQANKDVLLVEVPDGTHVFRKVAALESENVRVDKATSDFIHKPPCL